MTKTKIEWCDFTWNPVWGCRNNCPYCYARKMAKRIARQMATKEIKHLYPGEERPAEWLELYKKLRSFEPAFLYSNLERPFPKKPSRIFVDSMSDIAFWEDIWLLRVLNTIVKNPQHTFIFLTKQPECYQRLNAPFPINCWLGATITTNDEYNSSQEIFLHLDHNMLFINIEPIIERIYIDDLIIGINPFDWLIIGAETGNRKEKIIPRREWIEEIYSYCWRWIPIFMKDNLKPIWGEKLIQEFPKRGWKLCLQK